MRHQCESVSGNESISNLHCPACSSPIPPWKILDADHLAFLDADEAPDELHWV